MGKTVFTFLFLIVSLVIATKIQTFVANNRSADAPVVPIIDESNTIDLVNPAIYNAETDGGLDMASSTSTTTIEASLSTSTDQVATSSAPIVQ